MSRCRLSHWHMIERVKILGRYVMRYFLKGWETLLELEILTAVVYDLSIAHMYASLPNKRYCLSDYQQCSAF